MSGSRLSSLNGTVLVGSSLVAAGLTTIILSSSTLHVQGSVALAATSSLNLSASTIVVDGSILFGGQLLVNIVAGQLGLPIAVASFGSSTGSFGTVQATVNGNTCASVASVSQIVSQPHSLWLSIPMPPAAVSPYLRAP